MRRSFGAVALLALLGPFAITAADPVSEAAPVAAVAGESQRAAGPNTIVVITDDMRADEMWVLPATRRWLARSGITYSRAYAPTPLCCPARATILTGKYAHNTGVLDNTSTGTFAGGFTAFDDTRTLATELQGSGVTTGYIGKYLNEYASLYVPPGWDMWMAGVQGQYRYRHNTRHNRLWSYQGRTVYNFNGTYVTERGYETTVQTRLATEFIETYADDQFYLELNWLAPHGNLAGLKADSSAPIPHESHEHDFDDYRVPRTAAYNEEHMGDKPKVMRGPSLTRLELASVDHLAEMRLETLRSVDDGMVQIRAALEAAGIHERTNVLFVSDNGFMLGEHRIRAGKKVVYEPSGRVPLLMAGPGVPRSGAVRSAPVGLHDIAPTVMRLFGLGTMPGADGRPLFGSGSLADRDIMLQGSVDAKPARSYTGLRTPDGYKYVEYHEGGVELYDLNADPLEVSSLAKDPAYAALRRDLAQRLATLRVCQKESCR
jgi:arylsulfatase A-like enzyme